MGKLVTWKCDECGAIKRESNDWWAVYRQFPCVVVSPLDTWDERALESDGLAIVCGEECRSKKINKQCLKLLEMVREEARLPGSIVTLKQLSQGREKAGKGSALSSRGQGC